MSTSSKPIVWLKGEVRTPPFSRGGRREAGFLLRMLQLGESIPFPASRPTPAIGRRCHELRIDDQNRSWRIIYRMDQDAIVVLAVFKKASERTPRHVVDACRSLLARYDAIRG